jgi:hypothetical protein
MVATHYAWSIRRADEIAYPLLRVDDVIWARLLPGRPKGRGLSAVQTLEWIMRRELGGEWTSEMRGGYRAAQLKLSEKIAARRIHPWGTRPGSDQLQLISNDLFSPSDHRSGYRVVVTLHGDLTTDPPHKQWKFEEEYKDDSKWRDIIFFEDKIRREWRAAGRAAPGADQAEAVTATIEPAPKPTSAQPGHASQYFGQDRMVDAEKFGAQPKERRRIRGPVPKTTERVVTAIKDDIRTGYLTVKEGRLFKGSHRALQKDLVERYKCSPGTLYGARDTALLELETPTNSDQTPTNSDKK